MCTLTCMFVEMKIIIKHFFFFLINIIKHIVALKVKVINKKKNTCK